MSALPTEINEMEATRKHGGAALALLRRLKKHLDERMPERANAHVRDAIDSFFVEMRLRDKATQNQEQKSHEHP